MPSGVRRSQTDGYRTNTRLIRPKIKGKTELVLKSLLAIHENITDLGAMQGYEGLPEQVEEIYWEVLSLLERKPDLRHPEEVLEEWMEDYATNHLH